MRTGRFGFHRKNGPSCLSALESFSVIFIKNVAVVNRLTCQIRPVLKMAAFSRQFFLNAK